MTWDDGWEYAEEHGEALARWIEERSPRALGRPPLWLVESSGPLVDPEES